jgi:hypothetical protein
MQVGTSPAKSDKEQIMKNKRSILIGGLLAVLAVAVLVGAGVKSVYAQSGTTGTTTTPMHGHGPGGRGGGSFTWLQTAAEKLGMTTDELITALQSGKTLEQIATDKGLSYTDVQSAIQQAEQTAMRDRIQQGVTDGTISQEKADWLLEGLNKGFIGNGPDGDMFFGGKHGLGIGPGPQGQPGTQPTQPSAQPTQSSGS